MYDPPAAIRPKRFAEELARVWNEHVRVLYRGVTRTYAREFMKLLDATIEFFVSRFTNAPRRLEDLKNSSALMASGRGCRRAVSQNWHESRVTLQRARAARMSRTGRPCAERLWLAPDSSVNGRVRIGRSIKLNGVRSLRSLGNLGLPRARKLSESVASVRGRRSATQLLASQPENYPLRRDQESTVKHHAAKG